MLFPSRLMVCLMPAVLRASLMVMNASFMPSNVVCRRGQVNPGGKVSPVQASRINMAEINAPADRQKTVSPGRLHAMYPTHAAAASMTSVIML